MIAIIAVRYYGRAYVARAVGMKVRATSTHSALYAARQCAVRAAYGPSVGRRAWAEYGLVLEEIAPHTWLARHADWRRA